MDRFIDLHMTSASGAKAPHSHRTQAIPGERPNINKC